MVPADRKGVAVTGNYDHVHLRLGKLDARCECESSSVSRVKRVEINVAWKSRSAADTADQNDVVLVPACNDFDNSLRLYAAEVFQEN